MDTFVMTCQDAEKFIRALEVATNEGYGTFSGLKHILEQVPMFTNHVSNLLIHGGATSQTSADIQKGDGMSNIFPRACDSGKSNILITYVLSSLHARCVANRVSLLTA